LSLQFDDAVFGHEAKRSCWHFPKNAGAHEVLVSSTVKDLVAGSGLRFADRGNRTLKGVPGEWHIYAVKNGGRASPE
jgi:hypothetical protein